MLPSPRPQPTHCTRIVLGSSYRCYFDRLLLAQPLDPTNWRIVDGELEYNVDSATVTADYVRLTVSLVGAATTPDGCYYFADPADVRSIAGYPAAPFDALPIT